MSFTFPGGARRPVIDINSENLMFVWNLPRWIDIGEIKRSLQPKYGRIKFVETFEAWREGRRMGQIILDFGTYSSLSAFTKALSNKEEFNYEGVEFMCFDPKIGQKPFFNFVRQQTGVDLLACEGVPPTFEYKRKGPSTEREQQNPNTIPLRPRVRDRDSFTQPRGTERIRYNRDDDDDNNGRSNGAAQAVPSPRGVGRGFGQISSRFGNRELPPPSDESKRTAAFEKIGSRFSNRELPPPSDESKRTASDENEPEQRNVRGDENRRVHPIVEQRNDKVEDEQNHRTDSPLGDFGSNPPSRNFARRISRPKPSFLGENRSEGFFAAVDEIEENGGHVKEVSQSETTAVDDTLLGMDEDCTEDAEVDSAFGGANEENDDEIGQENDDDVGQEQQQGKEEGEERDEGKGTPSADDDGEEGANKSDGRTTDSSFTQYREKSRSREDSVSEDRDGHGVTGVKNTLKITQLDFGFDISKILEALQTVGEVVRFERLGKTSAAFTFDDAAEAANASVLVVDDLAAPNAFFQLMTAEEAYQYQ
ncbi:hypothetical protein niasHT_014424 [Heterodera trifolii]|uniref:RRM domain-containing protein n=1 Tax=Heterodera trifolii TaxID=157864 RepID=A0ABD2LHC4_9BILA